MKSIWSGAISFGLVNIPVNLYSAIEPRGGLEFDMLDKHTMSKIHYKRFAEATEKEVQYRDIIKGYEYNKGEYIIVSKKDFEDASPEKSKTITIEKFVDAKDVETIFYHKPYFLEPIYHSEKPYILLLDALSKSKKVGVAQFVLKNKEHLVIIRPFNHVLILEMLWFKSEIRDFSSLKIPNNIKISQAEHNMAVKLINDLSDEFKPEAYHDNYTDLLKKLIKNKLKGKKSTKKGSTQKPVIFKDLMETLKASLEISKMKAVKKRTLESEFEEI